MTPLATAETLSAATTEAAHIHNLSRAREDAWNRLRDLTRRRRRLDELDAASIDELDAAIETNLAWLEEFERYFAFPGPRILGYLRGLFAARQLDELAAACLRVARLRTTGHYRKINLNDVRAPDFLSLIMRDAAAIDVSRLDARPYFELLLIDDIGEAEEAELRRQLHAYRAPADRFVYEVVVVHTLEDALLAVLANRSIQAVVTRFSFPLGGGPHRRMLDAIYTMADADRDELARLMPGERTARLGALLRRLRPELDVYRVTDAPIEIAVAADAEDAFRRHFYKSEDYLDLHVSILKGVHDRFETPFFGALRRYSEKPTGMFHALPVSRARTIAKSNWIGDFGDFYGQSLFMAETSATTGGLDSLLQPTGSLKRAQELAARAFGADQTFFVTNGTSTANKIVMQALVRPGDLVLLSHDCHKSHPYGVILSGALPVYLDPYPLPGYSMYGGVTLETITTQLRGLEAAGKLDRVRLLLLTNLTFDGITYDPYRVMKAVLAIKPDMVFVWDEAWFAYGRFSPLLRRRTAIECARRLDRELRSPAYRSRYAAAEAAGSADGLPDPDRARVRVYATQSTHKTLTSLRQGSMIHIHDIDFGRRVEEVFQEAYMTHTSTSPNYQILASLDVGRRQVELEGCELVGEALELALSLRAQIASDPLLQRWFSVLDPRDMVPAAHRTSGCERYEASTAIERAWGEDEFVLDPTRVTLCVGRTGMDGDTFKKLLMDRYDIHINKTSRNSVLFVIHIGMTRGTIAHLLKVLRDIARQRERWYEFASTAEQVAAERRVRALMHDVPPLPNFSRFHAAYADGSGTPDGDMRRAFFAAYDADACTFVPLDQALLERVTAGAELVAATFLTPYPPGFPVLVPGQVLTPSIVSFLLALDVKELHGLDALGIRVFTEAALASHPPTTARAGRRSAAEARPDPSRAITGGTQ